MENTQSIAPIELLEAVKTIARQAGDAIWTIYQQGDYQQSTKADDTPVTSADLASNEVLMAALGELAPDIPIISEEMTPTDFAERKQWQRYWLLDPLDGTQEFISRSGDFAVNIALIDHGWPVLGVIYWPKEQTTYFAVKGHGTHKQTSAQTSKQACQIHAIRESDDIIRIAISRVQNLTTVSQYLFDDVNPVFAKYGSCALKSCFVAEGLADCYLRVGPTGEWDTGAPQIIVEEAGGKILDSEFNSLSYNQRTSLKNPDFFVLGDQSINWSAVIKPHKTKREY
ncbi:MAG: 3'(2'), 5'-bisphosphate nucleotidase [Phenylobacterium sp.]|jgi:3'(2'), 5'-bisphosphate nucleotidase